MATPLRDDLQAMAKGWRWGKRPLVPRSAEVHEPPQQWKEFPTGWARTPVARAVRSFVLTKVFKPLVRNETKVSVEGLDVLDDLSPPVMFVSNHSSHLDTPLILCALPEEWRDRTAVGAAADYFFDVKWRAASTALVFNTFPIERQGSGRGIGTARRLVEEGWNLVVFPEGTRSRDGWVHRFRHGTARLSIEYGLPMVPIAIRGAFAAMPRGRAWPVRGRYPVSVRFGPPLRPRRGEDHRELSARLARAVARLWDEDRTTWWESLKREAAGETPIPTGPQGARWRRVWEASRPLDPRAPERVWRSRP
jgi:1-acyl-sn-glycerol-3-phosphate acyltransferase